MFHKTTLAIHYPNPDPRATDNDFLKPVLSWLRDMLFGGGFPEFPPSLQEEPIDGHLNKFREGDSNLWPEASGWRAYAFPDGFPNTVVLASTHGLWHSTHSARPPNRCVRSLTPPGVRESRIFRVRVKPLESTSVASVCSSFQA